MSFGYVRKRSPAAISAARRAAGAARYGKRLTELRLISTVDRDANPGARMALCKVEDHMSVAESIMKAIESPADMLVKAIEARQIDAMDAWLVITKLAVAAFPGVNEAQATTSYLYGTDAEGIAVSRAYREMPDLTPAQKFQKIAKAAGEVQSVRHSPRIAMTNPTKTTCLQASITLSDLALENLAIQHMKRPGNEKLTKEQAFTDLATHNPLGQKLMTNATSYDLRRAARA